MCVIIIIKEVGVMIMMGVGHGRSRKGKRGREMM